MKRKKFLRLTTCGLALTAAVFSSACSFFAGGGTTVSDVSCVLLEDGRTQITVTYSDGTLSPSVFYLPQKEPNGIYAVTSAPNPEGTATLITVTYTDPDREPSVFELPNGKYISEVVSATDSSGNVTLTLRFSDGSESEQIVLQSGRNGSNGDTITDISTNSLPDGSRKIVITLSSGAQYGFTVPAAEKGEDGKGLLRIETDPALTAADPDGIWLNVVYTDGTSERMEIPKNNVWRNGAGTPSGSLGNVGDYYVDTTGCKVFYKQSSSEWTVVMDFSQYSEEYHTVRFIVDAETGLELNALPIQHGKYFYGTAELPTPSKSGYEFLGWFTGADDSVNSGRFTDLTVVLCDMTLYAHWRQA